MIVTDEQRASYLRTALGYLEGLPLLIAQGTPDQVHLELRRARDTIRSVIRSLEPPPEPVHPPLADCEDCA